MPNDRATNCVCTHPQREHLGYTGRCNEGTKTCRCQAFHTETRQISEAPTVRTVVAGRCELCWGIAVYHSAAFGTTPEQEYDHLHSEKHVTEAS